MVTAAYKIKFVPAAWSNTEKKTRVHAQNPFNSDQQSVILQKCKRD